MLAKTSRPRLSAVYQRSRLFDQLDIAWREHSVALVHGPPGAGKTTLVSSYIEFRNRRCLWYQVDSGDEDVATFFHYFGQAAKEHLLAAAAPLPDFDPGTAADLVRFSRQYFRRFYAGLKSPLVVVLDNYQEVADASPLHVVVQVACKETPENCHLVIATRDACPTPLAAARFNHTLTIIGADDLILTREETSGVAELQGMKLPAAAATLLQARSAGWMMGLMLMLERTDGIHNGTDLNLSLGDQQGEPVFDYFSVEVFKKLDITCHDLLLQSALLPKMTIPRVTQLTGTPKAGELLRELIRRNYFITRYGGKEPAYQFHPLFREFLLEQAMARYSAAELGSKYCIAAELLITDGDNEAAIDLLEQARNWRRLAEVILASASTLKAQGRDATLVAWMEKLPADVIGTDPWLLYWHGSSKAFSDPAASQAILENAYRQFSVMDDLVGMAMSWSGLIDTIFYIYRNLRQMDPWVGEFNERLTGRLELLPQDLYVRVTIAFVIALSFRQPLHPDLLLWRERLQKIMEHDTCSADRPLLRHRLVTYYILRGEHAEAESVLSMLHYAINLPSAERPPRTPVDYINEATVAMHTGMKERCLQSVQDGLRAAERTGNRLFDSVLLQLGAVMSLNRGDLVRTDEFLAAFERLAEPMPSVDRGAYYAVAAWRKFYAGEPTLALQLLGRAVAASEARGTPYYIAVDNLGFGLLLHLCGRNNEALLYLKIGRRVGASIKNPLIEYAYQLFSAFVALDAYGKNHVLYHLANGMRLGRQHGYMHFFFFPPRVISKLCSIALEADIETAYVRTLIERNELNPDPTWRDAELWPWPIRVYTLGRFSVVKQGTALQFSGKAQKKPLELLKALIALGGRDVSEARLADALWPDAEGDAAAQALATTLFRLRKLIGEQAIRRQENRLTINPTFCWVDCWAFERLSGENSGDSQRWVEKLRKLYQGPFLDGTDDAPWAQSMRERLQARFARLTQIPGNLHYKRS
ncbi:transcriptional regulator [Nitrosospira sp. Nsp2]|uniref:AAA family ATPase n=1 Tax=Nitrosospira sp. Nsp2 TaxID=136548 RepID=UPI000D320065|nr:AAA family ATPase [Nitrosospira sp. Nsp2]PTR13652.1 transcriptional regulator [Nitrosospira sp. Nsp2]